VKKISVLAVTAASTLLILDGPGVEAMPGEVESAAMNAWQRAPAPSFNI
jgi:hypothetical protein